MNEGVHSKKDIITLLPSRQTQECFISHTSHSQNDADSYWNLTVLGKIDK